MLKKIAFVSIFSLAVGVVILFIFRNNQPVPADLVFVRFDRVALWTVMVGAFVVGAIFSAFIFGIEYLSLWFRWRTLEKDMQSIRAATGSSARPEQKSPAAPPPGNA